LLLSFILSRH